MRHFILFGSSILLLSLTLTGCKEADVSVDEVATTPEVTDDVTEISFTNTKCPIMGGKPTTELTAEYNGQTIGFCCDGCPQKWATLSEEEQAEKFAKVSVAAADEHSDHEGHSDDEG